MASDSIRLSESPRLPSQTVIIPAYNESFRIERTLRHILSYLDAQPYSGDVMLVDDGSTDNTYEIAQQLTSEYSNLEVRTIPHGGKAAAVIYGMEQAGGDMVLFTDADLATPINYLEPFREAANDGYDVVIGSREGDEAARIGEPRFRHFMGRGFNGLVRILLLPGIHDTQCGFKLFTREANAEILSRLRLYRGSDGGFSDPKVTAFDVELLVAAKRLGLQIKVIPVTWTFGERSKVSPVGDTITNFVDVAKVKWNDLRGLYD